jgi:hypothetical protein
VGSSSLGWDVVYTMHSIHKHIWVVACRVWSSSRVDRSFSLWICHYVRPLLAAQRCRCHPSHLRPDAVKSQATVCACAVAGLSTQTSPISGHDQRRLHLLAPTEGLNRS